MLSRLPILLAWRNLTESKKRLATSVAGTAFAVVLMFMENGFRSALLDGTVAAHDDTSLAELWKINVGSGFSAPPMTFEVNGKQYVAIMSGLSPISKRRLGFTPELREQRNQTMLFVFGL